MVEKLVGKFINGHTGYAGSALVNTCFSGNSFGHAYCRLEDTVGQWSRAVISRGHFVSLFNLRQDLWFADDHAVKAGGSGKKMLDRFFTRVIK